MRALILSGVALAALAGAALAQTTTRGSGVTSSATTGTVNAQLVALLNDNYEIEAGFAEAGVPYVILQKGTSAYLCRGAGASGCEKLN